MNRMPLSIILAVVVCATLRQASAFTSMQVFGDGVSTTTSNATTQTELFYGKRFCNGRVWVEVLAERQGLSILTNQNLSYFGHESAFMVTNVLNFPAPADASTSLFILWVCNADFVDIINLKHPNPFYPTNMATWTNGINQAISNHFNAVQLLYNKGVRNLMMPNGVDVAKIPYYYFMPPTNKTFVRQRVIEFNLAFSNLLQQVRSTFTNLSVTSPDFFRLMDQMMAQPAGFGMTNTTESAVYDYSYTNFTGPGTNFLFWDQYHPTAKAQEILADTAQQMLSPAKITGISSLNGTNQLSVVNLPIGLNGFVDGTTNLLSWSAGQGFSSTNATQVIAVPVNGPRWFYRLRFPFAWSWP